MSYKSIGLDVVGVLEGTDIPDFLRCWRETLLDYVAAQVKGGLPDDLIRYLPVMCRLLDAVECIPNELPETED